MKNINVYLAGGLSTNWRDEVKTSLKEGYTFFDPKKHELRDSNEYTIWDLHFVKESDIVFAYMENSNPSGFGLTLEIGFATALNKTIILVDEKSVNDSDFKGKFKIVRGAASIVYDNLNDGILFLRTFSRQS